MAHCSNHILQIHSTQKIIMCGGHESRWLDSNNEPKDTQAQIHAERSETETEKQKIYE